MKRSQLSIVKRVAFYIYSLNNGGAERVTSLLANELSDNHVEVTVFVMKAIDSNSYRLADNVQVVDISQQQLLKSSSSGLLANLKRLLVLRRLIKEYSPQVLYTMMVESSVVGTIALVGTGIPCVVSERNDPVHLVLGKQWRALRKLTYGISHAVVAQTPRVKLWLEKNTRASTIVVIPNPVDFPMLDGPPFVKVPKNREHMVLGVGRLCPQKQFTHLIEEFSALSAEFPEWWLAILGVGDDHDELNTKILEVGLADKIRLIGRVGNIGDWYKEAKMFVMTSRYEGYPNALIEAMANGVPAVSYDCPSGPADVIQDNVNGLLVAANNSAELNSKMRLIMSNAAFAADLSREAIVIRSTLNTNVVVRQWLSVAGLRFENAE